jgi:hypothetical protein
MNDLITLGFVQINLFKKQCPECNCNMVYNGVWAKYALKRSIKRNYLCMSCTTKGERNGFFGKTQSLEARKTIKAKRKLQIISEETKKKLAIAMKGSKNPFFGKTHTNEIKLLLSEQSRMRMLERVKKYGGRPSFNPIACKFIDKLNEQNGWQLQHALNGGEVNVIGFSLDGYDKERNIIFEYDEQKHHQTWYKKKDLVRQEKLISKLNPSKFIRYDELNNKLITIL